MAQTVKAVRPRVVVEVDGPEETVLARVREEEIGERPFHGEDESHKDDSGSKCDLPELPGLGPMPEQIQCESRNDQEYRELRWDKVRYRIEDRPQLGLCGKERKNQNECDDRSRVSLLYT